MSMLLRRAMMMASSLVKHIISSVTGLVSFSTNVAADMPSVLCELPYDAGGYTSLTIYTDPYYGGTIYWNQVVKDGNFTTGTDWNVSSQLTKSIANNKMTVTATAKSTYANINQVLPSAMVNGHKTLVTCYVTMSQAEKIAFGDGTALISGNISITANTRTFISSFKTITATGRTKISMYTGRTAGLEIGSTVIVENFMFFDLTEMFGAGNEPATIAEFQALFPADYYAYNTGTMTTVGAVRGNPGQTVSVTFPTPPGSVTEGTLDAAKGILTDGGGNEYQFTPEHITAIAGDNYVWSNSGGGITVEYYDNH